METRTIAPAASRSPGALAIAFAGGALLVDLAFETIRAGSPLRWWTLLATAAYLGSVVVTYRARIGWRGRLAVVFVALLGTLAVAAWLPSGLTDGVRMLGGSTTRVLAAVIAAALLASSVVIVRATTLPLYIRIAGVLLAVYGAVSFGIGSWESTSYPALFHGGSAWRALPRLLQGSLIGTLIVLPFALVVTLAGGLVRGKRAWPWEPLALLGLTLAIALAGLVRSSSTSPSNQALAPAAAVPAPATNAAAGQPSTAVGSPSPPPDDASIDQGRDKVRAALMKASQSTDRAQVDIAALQARLGTDPRAIANFVQSEITYQAYEGALRGARGTLLARAGNSADRALLLASLLRSAGMRTRFAEGTLAPKQAEDLVRSGARAVAPRSVVQTQAISSQAYGDFVWVGDALYNSGFRAPTSDNGQWDRAVREAQHHFWVQVQRDQQWIDIDVAPGVPYGTSLVATERTSPDLDRALAYSVHIGVEVELLTDGKPRIERVLDYTAAATDLTGMPLGLLHDVEAQTATPVLLAGRDRIRGTAFQGTASAGSGLMPDFSSVFGGQPANKSATAEWLRIRISGPRGDREITYPVFDVVGSVARREGRVPDVSPQSSKLIGNALNGVVGISIVTGSVSPAAMVAVASEVDDPTSKEGAAQLLAAQNLAYVASREAVPTSLLDTQPASYIDFPNVLISQANGDIPPQRSIDLSLKAYRTLRRPEDTLKDRGTFYDYLSAGVIDHSVERWVSGADVDTSVGALLEAAQEQGVPARVVTSENQLPPGLLTSDGHDTAVADLSRRRVLVLPGARPIGWNGTFGWWSVDPSSGWTEDTAENGGHRRNVEYASKTRDSALRTRSAYCGIGFKIVAVVFRVMAVFGDPATSAADNAAADGMDAGANVCGGSQKPPLPGPGRLPKPRPPIPGPPPPPPRPPWLPKP